MLQPREARYQRLLVVIACRRQRCALRIARSWIDPDGRQWIAIGRRLLTEQRIELTLDRGALALQQHVEGMGIGATAGAGQGQALRAIGRQILCLLVIAVLQAMLDVATVYEEERASCEAARDAVDWKSDTLQEGVSEVSCRDCGYDLLRPSEAAGEVLLECSRCGSVESPDSYVPKAIKSALEDDAYSSMKDGGDDPYADCPECGQETR